MPILCVVSALWSEFPATTLRYGAQFLFTCFVGVLFARMLTPRRFLTVMLVMLFSFCVASILSGRQGISAEGLVLIGLTGSKNQMGFAAQLLLMASLAVMLLREPARWLRWIAVLSLPICGYILLSVNSATALITAVLGTGMLYALWVTERFLPAARLAAIAMFVLIAAPLVLLAPEANAAWEDFLYNTLDKDPTLTGRTTLWERADDLIAQRPLVGWGYQAIWLGDSVETLTLKRMTGQPDLRGFHFHHQFRQAAVDTGLIGMFAFIGAVLAVAFAGLRQLILRPSVATSFFFVIFVLMIARSFTDVIIGPFSIHTILFFAACVYAFWRPQEVAAPAVQPAGPQLRASRALP